MAAEVGGFSETADVDVLRVGAVTADYVGTVTRQPEEGLKSPLETLSKHNGGMVATAVAAVARLGDKACLAAKLGYSDMSPVALQKPARTTGFLACLWRSKAVRQAF